MNLSCVSITHHHIQTTTHLRATARSTRRKPPSSGSSHTTVRHRPHPSIPASTRPIVTMSATSPTYEGPAAAPGAVRVGFVGACLKKKRPFTPHHSLPPTLTALERRPRHPRLPHDREPHQGRLRTSPNPDHAPTPSSLLTRPARLPPHLDGDRLEPQHGQV